MEKTVSGIVHGRTIELEKDLGIADGEKVEVTIRNTSNGGRGEGLRRCAGALASQWTSEDDRILEEIYRDRKRETRKEVPE